MLTYENAGFCVFLACVFDRVILDSFMRCITALRVPNSENPVFLLNNDHVIFYACQVTYECGKKTVSIAILQYIPFLNCLKNHLMRA